jgi:hypothetical protein
MIKIAVPNFATEAGKDGEPGRNQGEGLTPEGVSYRCPDGKAGFLALRSG